MQTDHAARYANLCLSALGCDARVDERSDHPALAWRRSGLLTLTAAMPPTALPANIDGVLMALRTLCPHADLPASGAGLMGERARLMGLRSPETVGQSSTGVCRLLETATGHLALNLSRPDDWDILPAWLEAEVQDWDDVAETVRGKSRDYLCTRGAELGLALAIDTDMPAPTSWCKTRAFKAEALPEAPLVVDLSSLWAGPLASHILLMTGARVVKVESPNRPDGMRSGNTEFNDLMNGGKDCVALDFRSPGDLQRLHALLGRADIVIEASRPRALQQLGIEAEAFVAAKPGQIWARMTAYGRHENRVGFGDDIGVSAGLSHWMTRAHGTPRFVGDAIADPVNGLHLALAIVAAWQHGGGCVIDLTMRDVLRNAMGDYMPEMSGWEAISLADNAPLYPLRAPEGLSKLLGADNGDYL